MQNDLVTIYTITRDEETGAQKVLLQLNDSDVVGRDDSPPGASETLEVDANEDAYNAVKARYPDAAIHSPESLNEMLEAKQLKLGTRIKLASGELIKPEEAARRNEIARQEQSERDRFAKLASEQEAATVEEKVEE